MGNMDQTETLLLIKEYESRPILWNKDHNSYHNMVKKSAAWRELGDIMRMDVLIVKKKIESLRGTRRREKNRMLKSLRTKNGTYA